jgi:hypothetical protein
MTPREEETAEPGAARPAAAARPRRAATAWGLLCASGVTIYCGLIAGPPGNVLIYGWFLVDGWFPNAWLVRVVLLAALLCAGFGFAMMLRATQAVAQTAALASLLAADWRRRAALLVAGGMALSLAVVWLLHAFPNSGDSYAYLFEAETFLAGRLWNPLPPLAEFFRQYHLVFLHSKWASLYNPGWPILLAGALAMRLPAWLVNPLCGGLLLFVVLKLAVRRDGPLGGLLATALVALSPFFLFNAASYFNHVSAAVAGLLFCWAATAFLDRPSLSLALLSGMALGALGLIRAVDVPIFAVPFAVAFFGRVGARHYRLVPAIGAAGLPFLILLMGFYFELTGWPTPSMGHTATIGLAPIDEHGHHFTFLHQLAIVAERIMALAEWNSPLLVLGLAVAYARLTVLRRLSFIDLVFPSFIIAYLLIPFDGANQYGPRYYFEAFPLIVLTLVSGLVPMLQDAAQAQRRAVAWFLLAAHGALCVLVFGAVSYWVRTLVDQRMDLYDQVRAQRLRDAVVIVRSSTSPIYPMKPRDLVRNGLKIDGAVIYALDIPDRLQELRRAFPNRRFYIYERRPEEPVGSLRPLRSNDGAAQGGAAKQAGNG